MSVTYRGATTATGTTVASPTVHASAVAGVDAHFAFVVCRSGSGSVATPSGWSKLIDIVATAGTVRLYLFHNIGATAGSTVTLTGTGTASIAARIMCFYPGSGEVFDTPLAVSGEDTTSHKTLSITASSGFSVAAGDVVAAGSGLAVYSFESSQTVAGMAGATIGTTADAANTGTSTGSPLTVGTCDAPITAGTSSAAPAWSATTGTNTVTVGIFVRVRAVPATTTVNTLPGIARASGFWSVVKVNASVLARLALTRAFGFTSRVTSAESSVDTRHALARAVGFPATVKAGARVASTVGWARAKGFRTKVEAQSLPPAPPWQIFTRTQAWADLMAAPRRMTSVRVDLIDETDQVVARFGGAEILSLDGQIAGTGEVPIRRGVAAWQVQAVADDPVTRTCSLTLTDPSFVPRPGAVTDLFHPLGRRRARIWWLLWDGSQWLPVLLGTFHLDAPSIDGDGVMSIGGFDSVGLIKKAKWIKPLSLGGVACHTAIQRILTARAPWITYSITPTPYVLPAAYEVGSPGDDPWDDVERIQAAAGLLVQADRFGQVVGELRDSDRAVVADFTEGPGCTMTDLSRTLSLTDFANVVQISSSNSSVDPPVTATARNTDQASPGWVGYGYEYVYTETSDTVTTYDQALAVAKSRLTDKTALAENVSLTARADPVLDPLDLVTVGRAKAGAAGTYQVQAISWSDDPLMSVDLAERRVFL